jgi:hypothetical protein
VGVDVYVPAARAYRDAVVERGLVAKRRRGLLIADGDVGHRIDQDDLGLGSAHELIRTL